MYVYCFRKQLIQCGFIFFLLSFICSFASLAAPYPQYSLVHFAIELSFYRFFLVVLRFNSLLQFFFLLFLSFWHNTYSSLPCLLSDLKCNYRLAFPNILCIIAWQSHSQLYNMYSARRLHSNAISFYCKNCRWITNIFERYGSKWTTEQKIKMVFLCSFEMLHLHLN